MSVNVQVESKPGENPVNVLRRFSRRVNQANIVRRAKAQSERTRPASEFERKKKKLHKIERTKEYTRLYKLGKIKPKTRRRR
jgi:ribosomal protein S21